MKKTFLLAAFALFLATAAQAQTATPASFLAWDQPNATATEAQGFTYTYFPDGATTGIAFTGVTCTGAPVVCRVPFPAFTPGPHAITVTATNAAGASPHSAPPFTFEFVVRPSAPANVRKE